MAASNSIGQLVAYIDADTTGLKRGVAAAKTTVSRFATGASKVLGGIPWRSMARQVKVYSAVTVLALGAISLSIIKTGADFEQSIKTTAGVMRILGEESVEQFAAITNIAREMGETTEWSATQSAQGLQFLGMAGLDAAQAVSALPPMLDLATAGQIELSKAADISTNIMSAMGLEVSALTHVGDVMVGTITNSNTNMEMMAESMKFAAPIARGFGMDMETLSAMIGLLGSAGIQGSMAGTQLAFAMKQSGKAAKELGLSAGTPLIEVLENMSEAMWSPNKLLDIFGARGGRAMLVLQHLVPEIKNFAGELKNNEGVMKTLADAMRDTVIGRFKELTSVIQEIKLTIYDEWATPLKTTLENASEWIRIHKMDLVNLAQAIKDKVVGAFTLFKTVIGEAVGYLKEHPGIIENTETAFKSLGKTVIFVAESYGKYLSKGDELARSIALATTGQVGYTKAILFSGEVVKEFEENSSKQRLEANKKKILSDIFANDFRLKNIKKSLEGEETLWFKFLDATLAINSKQLKSNLELYNNKKKSLDDQLKNVNKDLALELKAVVTHAKKVVAVSVWSRKSFAEESAKRQKNEKAQELDYIDFLIKKRGEDKQAAVIANEEKTTALEEMYGKWKFFFEDDYMKFMRDKYQEDYDELARTLGGEEGKEFAQKIYIENIKRLEEGYTTWLAEEGGEYASRKKDFQKHLDAQLLMFDSGAGSFVDGVKLGFQEIATEQKYTWGTAGYESVSTFTTDATTNLSTFFNFTDEEFGNIETLFDSMADSIAKIWSDMLAKMVAQWAASGVANLFTTGSWGGGAGNWWQSTAGGTGVDAMSGASGASIGGGMSAGTAGGVAAIVAAELVLNNYNKDKGYSRYWDENSNSWKTPNATIGSPFMKTIMGELGLNDSTTMADQGFNDLFSGNADTTSLIQTILGTFGADPSIWGTNLIGEALGIDMSFGYGNNDPIFGGGISGGSYALDSSGRLTSDIATGFDTKNANDAEFQSAGKKYALSIQSSLESGFGIILGSLPEDVADSIANSFSLSLGSHVWETGNAQELFTNMGTLLTEELSIAFGLALDIGLEEYGYDSIDQFMAHWKSSAEAIGDAFNSALDSGSFIDFKNNLRASIQDSVKTAMIAGVMNSTAITTALQPVYKGIEDALTASTIGGGFDAEKFASWMIDPLDDMQEALKSGGDLDNMFKSINTAFNDITAMLRFEDMPQAANGIDYVKNDGPVFLHQGEGVLTTEENANKGNSITIEGPLVNIEGPLVADADTFDQFVVDVGNKLSETLELEL